MDGRYCVHYLIKKSSRGDPLCRHDLVLLRVDVGKIGY
jgi:hypothetical protein